MKTKKMMTPKLLVNGCPIELHTHNFAEHVLYHISWEAFTMKGSHNMKLTSEAEKLWKALPKSTTRKALAALPN
jgi:hypothetical protein